MVDGGDRGALRGKNVLIVEDEALIGMLLEDILEDTGCRIVGPAMTFGQAMELARSAEIDVAVLDVNLAGEPSFPVAAVLASRGVPLVFSSGYGSQALPPEWQGRPTLPKPFTSNEVVDALAGIVSA